MKKIKIYKLNYREDIDSLEFSFCGIGKSSAIRTPQCEYRKDSREKSSCLKERCDKSRQISKIRRQRNNFQKAKTKEIIEEHLNAREEYYKALELTF